MFSSEISDRLNRLERSNRRLKATLTAFFCCTVAIMLAGASANSTVSKVIDVEKIILHDSAGNERGQLFASENASGLVFFNKNGSKAASLVASSGMNAVLLLDQNGNIRQSLTANLDESQWNIFGPGSDSAQFEVVDNGQGTALSFRTRANNPAVELGVTSKGGTLNMSDSKGAIRASMAGQDIGFATYTPDGRFQWAPGFDNFSLEERERIKALVPKMVR